jgi:cell division protein FtsZ
MAEPLRATVTPRPEPVAAEVEPVAASVAAEAPHFAHTADEEEQPDIFAAAQAPSVEPALEPQIAAPVARIVDPEAAEPGDERDEPLFGEAAFEPRKPRGGFLSIFGGRPRYDAPAAPQAQSAPVARATTPAPVRGGAQPLEAAAPEEADQNEDLEIPSFLRRLAN